MRRYPRATGGDADADQPGADQACDSHDFTCGHLETQAMAWMRATGATGIRDRDRFSSCPAAKNGDAWIRRTPEIRDEEAAAAAKALGLACRVNLGLPDGHLARLPPREPQRPRA